MISNNLLKRIIVAFSFGPVVVFLLWLGGYFWLAFLLVIVFLMLNEYLSLASLNHPIQKVLLFISALVVVFLFIRGKYGMLINFLVLFFVCESIFVLFKYQLESGLERVLFSVGGLIYIVVMPLYSYKIRHLFQSSERCKLLAMFPVFLMWLVDTVAYFYGCAYGKKKLMEKVSPNKTVEGFIAGVISGGVFGFLYHLMFRDVVNSIIVPLSILGAIIGQLGDLFESMLKRWAGVKDSSRLIPGHGGVLDRFDSFIFVQPLFYFFYQLFFMN